MNFRIFIGLIVFVLAGCFYSTSLSKVGHSNPSTGTAVHIAMHEQAEKAVSNSSPKNEEDFIQFISNISEAEIIYEADADLWNEATGYFSNTKLFSGHGLRTQFIAYQDSIFLLLWDFKKEATNKGAMYVTSFNQFGEFIDLIQMKSISFDGNISVNLFDKNIVEIKYQDFSIQKQSAQLVGLNHFSSQSSSTSTKKREPMTEQLEFQYYHIDSKGQFDLLTSNSAHEADRLFPQASFQILSSEELNALENYDLQLMRYEVYASHGYIFTEEVWSDYFSSKQWYNGQRDNIHEALTEVESINLKNIVALERSR